MFSPQLPDESGPDGAVIAIDIGGTKIDAALAGSAGDILERFRLPTLAEEGSAQALHRVADAVAKLTESASSVHALPVVAHAAVCPGVVQADRILFAPNLPGWEDLALADALSEELGVPEVAVANDTRAGALAELRYGALRDADPGIYVSLGTGIAAALTVGGQVLFGAHQAAGEIGYMTPGAAPSTVLSAGHAALEEVVGGKALGEAASRYLGEELDAMAVLGRSDPPALQVVHQALGALAAAIANIAVFIDPQRVVLGGGMMAWADVILPVISAHLCQSVPFPPEITAARFTEDASLHGAAALAFDLARALRN